MVSVNSSREHVPLTDSAKIYDTVKSVIGATDAQILSVSLSDVNERLLGDVSTNLMTALVVIRTELNTVLELVKDVANDASTIPTATVREFSSMPTKLKVDTISAIPSRVKMLLANFQNAVEDPKSLYPRLICCEVPIDPAKGVNFAKKYQVLDQMLQAETVGDVGDRSMPSAPKSAVDVITNVNSSLESVSDLLCESVDTISAVSESFEAIMVTARNIGSVSEAVDEVLNHHQEVSRVLDRVASMFSDTSSDGNIDPEGDRDAMQIIQSASSLLDNLAAEGFNDGIVPRLQSAKAVLSEFVESLTELFSRAKKAVFNLISILKKFVSSMPRISQELRQFFVPTGPRALIMKPSPDLLSLLHTVDDLRTVLPEPDTIERSTSDALETGAVVNRISGIQEKFTQLDETQAKLFETIANQDLLEIISETVKESLESILRDLQSSVTNIKNLVEDNLGIDDMASNLGRFLRFDARNSEDKPEPKDPGPAGVVENVTGAGGLLGRLFET